MVQTNCINKKILIICGPTASSKTSVAIECAKLLNSDVISADSMNVYTGLDIGTAKPSLEEMQGIKHHLIDVVKPNLSFSVGDYKDLAEPIVNNLTSSGKIPVICGGTGFYVNSLIYDFSYGNVGCNIEIREKYLQIALEKGKDYLFSILRKVDPVSASRLHPNDVKRVSRALEIAENGKIKSELNDTLVPKRAYNAYCIDFDRETLYERINKRVDIMFNSGLVDEVNKLISMGITIDNQCMQGIGYKEVYGYLQGEYSLDNAIELVKQNTRRYAKRQITFFKKLPNLVYLKPDSPKELAKRIVNEL